MKTLSVVSLLLLLSFSAQASEGSWWDSIKSMLGIEQEAETAAPDIGGMLTALTDNLNVDKSQAEGGLGALFGYLQQNVSEEQFSQLSSGLPGLQDIMKSAPDISQLGESGGLSGLLDKAAEYSDSLKAVNDLKKQFEALGLKPDMIAQYIQQVQQYLDTEQGQQLKTLITQGLSSIQL